MQSEPVYKLDRSDLETTKTDLQAIAWDDTQPNELYSPPKNPRNDACVTRVDLKAVSL